MNQEIQNPSLPPRLFVKNDDGGRADNVTVVIGVLKGTLRYKQERVAKQI
jgi:hypothetical protein